MEQWIEQARTWGPQAAKVAMAQVDRWLRRTPLGRTVTLLDTGLFSAEASMRLLRAARARGHALRVVSLVDAGMEGEPYGAGPLEAFEVVRLDPMSMVEHFGAGSFDFVCTQLRVATLREVPRLTFLRLVDRLAQRGVVWVERRGAGGLYASRMEELAERVGMHYLRPRRRPFSPWVVMRGVK